MKFSLLEFTALGYKTAGFRFQAALVKCRHSFASLVVGLLLLCLQACTDSTSFKFANAADIPVNRLEGQWVLVNYWAIWCKPCRQEIPELNSLNLTAPNVTVLGVDFDRHQSEELRELIKTMAIDFPVLKSESSLRNLLQTVPGRPSGLPTTLLIDYRGPTPKLVKTLQGPQTELSLKAALQASSSIQ